MLCTGLRRYCVAGKLKRRRKRLLISFRPADFESSARGGRLGLVSVGVVLRVLNLVAFTPKSDVGHWKVSRETRRHKNSDCQLSSAD